jgi:hypothetical protein
MPGRENAVVRQGCICAIAAVAVLAAAPVAHGAGLRAGFAGGLDAVRDRFGNFNGRGAG